MKTNESIKPATPLPWKDANADGEFITGDGVLIARFLRGSFHDREQDAAYIVAACNAYPRLLAERERLVEALREILASPNITQCPRGLWSAADNMNYVKVRRANALLREIEEGK